MTRDAVLGLAPTPTLRRSTGGGSGKDRRGLDRYFWLAILLTAAVVIPRSISIARAHSESYDDQFYLVGGLALLTREPMERVYNDPPLGQVIEAVPLWLTGCTLRAAARHAGIEWISAFDFPVLYGQPVSHDTLLVLIAAWKALLFVPLGAVVFYWCRKSYGPAAGWLALAMLLADPTVAAHVPVGAIDVLGVEGVVIGSFFAWRYFAAPSPARLVIASITVAAGVMMKLNGIVVPFIVIGYAIAHTWRRRSVTPSPGTPGDGGGGGKTTRDSAQAPTPTHPRSTGGGSSGGGSTGGARKKASLLTLIALVAFFAWAFTLCDISRPKDNCFLLDADYGSRTSYLVDAINLHLKHRWPGGIYIAALVESVNRNRAGSPGYLFGQVSRSGWWYYQPAVALFKVPLGVMLILLAGALSCVRRRIKFEELSLIVPAAVCVALLLTMRVSIGFRHALPAYVLLMMLASRCMSWLSHGGRIIAWCAVAATFVQGALWHPDELSFINLPWRRPYLMISDSNVDWGQGLKQAAAWLDAHRDRIDGRPVAIRYFGQADVGYYLGGRANILAHDDPLPTHGLLIVSPIIVAGAYPGDDAFRVLKKFDPVDTIGHSLLVYDLDRLKVGTRPSP